MTVRNQPTTAWRSLGVSEVAEQLSAGDAGLSEDAAATRIAEAKGNREHHGN